MYLFWERQRETGREEQEQRERDREGKNPKQAPHCQHRAQTVRWWPEPRSRVGSLTNWATQAPQEPFLIHSSLPFSHQQVWWYQLLNPSQTYFLSNSVDWAIIILGLTQSPSQSSNWPPFLSFFQSDLHNLCKTNIIMALSLKPFREFPLPWGQPSSFTRLTRPYVILP